MHAQTHIHARWAAFCDGRGKRSLLTRSYSSGRMNAKQQELLELQALAQRRLKGVRSNFNEGLRVARETKRDLEWTQKRVR